MDCPAALQSSSIMSETNLMIIGLMLSISFIARNALAEYARTRAYSDSDSIERATYTAYSKTQRKRVPASPLKTLWEDMRTVHGFSPYDIVITRESIELLYGHGADVWFDYLTSDGAVAHCVASSQRRGPVPMIHFDSTMCVPHETRRICWHRLQSVSLFKSPMRGERPRQYGNKYAEAT